MSARRITYWHARWAMHPARADRVGGFTLIEMLVAMTIFAIMSGVAYRALQTVLEARVRVAAEYAHWRDVVRAVSMLERDLGAATARPVRLPDGRTAPPLESALSELAPAVVFTRSGEWSAAGPVAPPRRMGYRVRDGVLEQLDWPALDAGPRTLAQTTPLLEGVRRMSLRFRASQDDWRNTWPSAAATATAQVEGKRASSLARAHADLPSAIEVTVDLAAGQRITRVVPVRGGVAP
jgi:general secretion pathway protein J